MQVIIGGNNMENQFGCEMYKCLIRQRADLIGLALCIPEINIEKLAWKFPASLAFSENERISDLAGTEVEVIRLFDDDGNVDISVPFTREELKNWNNEEEVAKVLAPVVKSHRQLINYYLRTRGMDPEKQKHLGSAHRLCLRHVRGAYQNWYSIKHKDKIRQKFNGVDGYLKGMKTIEAMSYLPATEMFYEMMALPESVPSELMIENVSRFSFYIAQNPSMAQPFFEHRMLRQVTGSPSVFIVDTLRGRFEECGYNVGKTPYNQMKNEERLAGSAPFTNPDEFDS